MTCHDARDLLPDLAFGGTDPDRGKALEAHLAGCAACRRELHELRHVRGLLAAVPPPDVRVDVAALYRAAAAREARRARRWRRLALAAGAAAAAAVVLAVGARLEVRVGDRQVVLRWGAGPTPEAPPAPAPVAHAAPPLPAPAASEEQLRLLGELVDALAADARDRDLRTRAELTRLRTLLVELGERDARRWSAAERDIDAMYAAQFGRKKGD
jgi:hypothetical protein